MLKKTIHRGRSERRGGRYVPHIMCGRLPLQRVLANGKASLVFATSKKLNVEPLSDAGTNLAEFFSILLADS